MPSPLLRTIPGALALLAAWHAFSWFGTAPALAILVVALLAWLLMARWWQTSQAITRIAGLLCGLVFTVGVWLLCTPFWVPAVCVEVVLDTSLETGLLHCSWGTSLQHTRALQQADHNFSATLPSEALHASPTLRFMPRAFDLGAERFPTIEAITIRAGDAVLWTVAGDALAGSLLATEGSLATTEQGIQLRPLIADQPFLIALRPAAETLRSDTRSVFWRLAHVLLYAFALAALGGGALARQLPVTWVKKLVLALLSSALGLVVAEGVARALLPEPTRHHVWQPGLQAKFRPMAGVMPGIEGEAELTINSIGSRGREVSPSDEYRILAIGGSTTECLYLDQKETWTGLLERNLTATGIATWVGNVGRSGLTTREHLLQVRELLRQKPHIDAVVLLVGINDLLLRLRQGDTYDPHAMDSPEVVQSLMSRAFSIYPQSEQGQRGIDQLALARLWQAVAVAQTAKAKASKVMTQDECGKFLITARQSRREAPRLASLPDLDIGLAEYRSNLMQIAKLAKSHGVRLVLATQPAMWNPDITPEQRSLLVFGKGVGGYYKVEDLQQGLDRYNAALREVAAVEQLDYVDLEAMLAKDTTVFCDDVHFNESGARKVAAALAPAFTSQDPFRVR